MTNNLPLHKELPSMTNQKIYHYPQESKDNYPQTTHNCQLLWMSKSFHISNPSYLTVKILSTNKRHHTWPISAQTEPIKMTQHNMKGRKNDKYEDYRRNTNNLVHVTCKMLGVMLKVHCAARRNASAAPRDTRDESDVTLMTLSCI